MSNDSILTSLNAFHFFTVAKNSIPSIVLGHETQALIPIIFSVTSLECFVNEIGLLSRMPEDPTTSPKPEFLVKLGNKIEARENEKVPLEEKLLDAKEILTGEKFNKGTNPFQDFKLLCKLRDALVHFKGEDFKWEQDSHGNPKFSLVSHDKKLLKGLKARKILKFDRHSDDQPPTDRQVGMIELVGTPEAAKWACNTAVEIVHSITNNIPDSSYTFLIKSYSHFFKNIP